MVQESTPSLPLARPETSSSSLAVASPRRRVSPLRYTKLPTLAPASSSCLQRDHDEQQPHAVSAGAATLSFPSPPSSAVSGSRRSGAAAAVSPSTSPLEGGVGQSRTVALMTTSVSSSRHKGTDLVASGNAMVAEVTAFLAQRARQRNTDTMRYLELRAQMKPPPPMTMEELEQHPLTKHKAKKHANKERELDMHDEEHEQEGSGIPFIAKGVAGADVMVALRKQIAMTARDLHLSKKPRVALSRAGITIPTPPASSARPWRTNSRQKPCGNDDDWEVVDWGGSPAGGGGGFVGSSVGSSRVATAATGVRPNPPQGAFLTEAPLPLVVSPPPPNPSGTPATVAAGALTTSPSTRALMMMVPSTAASPLSVRSLGPEHDKAILSRDPNELKKIRNDDRYSQNYRKPTLGDTEQLPTAGVSASPGGGGGGPAAISERVATFHDQMRYHTHRFHTASIGEIDRVRAAMHLFHPLKVHELLSALEDDTLLFATPIEVFSRARTATVTAARKKDNGERLDVFFDHLERLERYTSPTVPPYGRDYIQACLAEAKLLVQRKEGMQSAEDFDSLVEHTMPHEFLLHFVVADFLRMLAAIFGIGAPRFRLWLHDKLARFEERDYEPIFRKVEIAIGKEVSQEARCRLTLNSVRGCVASAVKVDMALRVQVERATVMTSVVSGGAKATWKESFILHMYDEASPVTVHLMIHGAVEGTGAFSIFRYPVGKVSTMWLPTPGPSIPHAEVNVSVEVLPLLPS